MFLALAFAIRVLTNDAWALELGELDDEIANLTRKLQTEISDTVSDALNSSGTVSSQTSIINGVCTNTLIGGDGNNTLSSSGNCNDQLSGGKGADTFICGEGTDVIRDYNSNEGDVIVDKEKCETIL